MMTLIYEFANRGSDFNLVFEEFMIKNYGNAVVTVTGRDIVCMIVGFLICLILWAIFDGKEIHVIRRRNNKDIPRDGCNSIQELDNERGL